MRRPSDTGIRKKARRRSSIANRRGSNYGSSWIGRGADALLPPLKGGSPTKEADTIVDGGSKEKRRGSRRQRLSLAASSAAAKRMEGPDARFSNALESSGLCKLLFLCCVSIVCV
jgi:hypothetical protein